MFFKAAGYWRRLKIDLRVEIKNHPPEYFGGGFYLFDAD